MDLLNCLLKFTKPENEVGPGSARSRSDSPVRTSWSAKTTPFTKRSTELCMQRSLHGNRSHSLLPAFGTATQKAVPSATPSPGFPHHPSPQLSRCRKTYLYLLGLRRHGETTHQDAKTCHLVSSPFQHTELDTSLARWSSDLHTSSLPRTLGDPFSHRVQAHTTKANAHLLGQGSAPFRVQAP